MDAAAGASGASLRSEALGAARNAVKLGSSLVATWGVAIGIRLLLPRYLGPDAFGVFNFADAFTTTLFALLSFGVDIYIRKEVTRDEDFVSSFFGGVLALRVIFGVLLVGISGAVLSALGRPPEVVHVLYAFGAAQILMLTNQTASAVLHARGTVGGLSVSNVVTKLLWGAGIGVAVWLRTGLLGIALALVLSEAVKFGVLTVLSHRHAGLRLRLDAKATWAVLVASLPLYVNMVAKGLYAKMDVTLLAFHAPEREVGFYGAASNLAGLTLLLTPLLGWVLMPLLARARAISEEQLARTSRNALELVLALAIPSALIIGVGAEYWSRWLFGEVFSPAAEALRFLAPMFVFTYVAMVSASLLVVLDRSWSVTVVTLVSVAVNAALNLLLVPIGARWLGAGGAGAGAAAAVLLSEAVVVVALLALTWRLSLDRPLIFRILRMVFAALATVVLDRELQSVGPTRLIIDFCFYTLAVLLTGAVRGREILAFARAAARRGQPTTTACPPSSAPRSSESPSSPSSR